MKKLYRPTNGRMLCGVAAGFAVYFGLDPTLVRVIFAIIGLMGGSGLLIYIACALLMPDEKNIAM